MTRDDEDMLELERPLDPLPPIATRAPAPRPRRLSRRAILLFAGGSSIGLAAAFMVAFGSGHHSGTPKETATIDHRQVTDLLATAPRDYAAAAEQRAGMLGPPAAPSTVSAALDSAASTPPAADDAARGGEQVAVRQRQQQQRESARASRLFASNGGERQPAAGSGPAPTSTAAPSETPAPTPSVSSDPQDRKAAFVASGEHPPSINSGRLTGPAGRNIILAGSTIAAALITGLSSDLPGEVVAQVTEDVFDSATGGTKLIPQGTRLIGSYDAHVSYGQSRALVVWTRLILPDGRSLELDRLIGTDAAGQSGFADRVNHHTGKLFEAALLSAVFGVGSGIASSGGDNAGIALAIRDSAGQSVSQAGEKIVDHQLDVQPTITIRPGARVRVLVSRDLVMESYTAGG